MSKINTLSVFYYGTKVTRNNYALDFSEDGTLELKASLNFGDYSLEGFALEIQRAMRVAGTQLYVATVNRTTRAITISAPVSFELWSDSGSRKSFSIYLLAGFNTGTDYTGAITYSGSGGAGFEYRTQYPVGDYVSETDSPTRESATFSVTPTGIGQMISFADSARVRLDIRLVTNLQLRNTPFFYNATGINDLKTFMQYLLDKNKVEFMADVADRATFTKVFLESTAEDRDGFTYTLKHMQTPEIRNTGRLIFRKVLE